MEKKILHIGYLVLIIGIAFFLGSLTRCSKTNSNNKIDKIDSTLHHDTVKKTVSVPTPYPVEVIKPVIDSVPYIDSAYCRELAIKYYTKRIYNDTLLNDSSNLIVLSDTVFKNELQKRKLYLKQTRATLTVTKYISQSPAYRVYLGIVAGFMVQGKGLLITPSVLVANKKDNIFNLGYDVINKTAMVGIYYKINLKRK